MTWHTWVIIVGLLLGLGGAGLVEGEVNDAGLGDSCNCRDIHLGW